MVISLHTHNAHEKWVLEKPDYFTAWVRIPSKTIKIEQRSLDAVLETAKELSEQYYKNILIYAVRDKSQCSYATYIKGECNE